MKSLITILLTFVGFLGAMFSSFKQGKKSQQAEDYKKMIKQNEKKTKANNFVRDLSDDDLNDLVREFRRKD